jgi:hypothetical protein
MSVDRVAVLSSEYPPHTYGGLGTVVEALSRFLVAEASRSYFSFPMPATTPDRRVVSYSIRYQ